MDRKGKIMRSSSKDKLKGWLDYLLVGVMSFFLVFGIYNGKITKICFVLGIILWICLGLLKYGKYFLKNFIFRTPLDKAVLLFLGVCVLSVVFSDDIYRSQKEFFNRNIIFIFFFFIGAYLSRDKKNFKILVFSLLTGAFISGVGGVVDIIRVGKFIRLFSSWGIGCFNGTYLLICLSFLLSIVIFHSSSKVKIISILATIPIFICFLFNHFRGAWLSLILALIICFFLFKQYRKIGLYTITVIIAIIFIIPVFRERLFAKKTLQPSTWGDRVSLWQSAGEIFLDYPIFGVGLGGFEVHNHKYCGDSCAKKHLYSHNVYLDVLSEMGILGLLSFLGMFVVFFWRIYWKLKFNFDVYKFAFMLMVASILLFQLTESTILTGVSHPAFFWFLFGVSDE